MCGIVFRKVWNVDVDFIVKCIVNWFELGWCGY